MSANSRPGAEPTAAPAARTPAPDPAALRTAWEALAHYDAGSNRAALIPIDDAVRAAETEPAARPPVETELVAILRGAASTVAREFACRKLASIGSAAAVPVLAGFLGDPALADAARAALECLPGPEPEKALRNRLPSTNGNCRVGIINSLGRRRDAASVSLLARQVNDPDAMVASAALAALGEIGSRKAAAALRALPAAGRTRLATAYADACLRCAEFLAAAGHAAEAERLCQPLTQPDQAAYLRRAAERFKTTGRAGK